MRTASITTLCLLVASLAAGPLALRAEGEAEPSASGGVDFSVRSVRSGPWSDPATWAPARLPAGGDRVLVSRGTRVVYDVESDAVIRLIQVAGTLSFARDRSTRLDVGLLKVQKSEVCSESGFACDFHGVNREGEPGSPLPGELPALEVGTPDAPIPAGRTARIRLHLVPGLDARDAPAIVGCSARMDFHGAPLSRTWAKLGADVEAGAETVLLAEDVSGWRPGDEVIVTGSERGRRRGSFRDRPESVTTEERRIVEIDGRRLRLDRPLEHRHAGSGEFRSEAANLSRSVIVESADPGGVRGHTLYHRFSRGSISYARFAHLGKEGVLGRYAIHFHRAGDTMRGSSVIGAAIVDSHNRWITVHGTHYLVVRDCVGYRSVGHGFFLEDGTEVYNVLDRNLGVQAYRGRRLPNQVLPFDPNDGAAFWWANGRNTLVRNVSCENDEYGFRYDMQKLRDFDSTLPVRMPDGTSREVDVRTIGIWRFEQNEAHTEGLYGVVIAANGDRQPDTPIRDQDMLRRIRSIDWTGPDTRHPHVVRDLKLWEVHYAIRPHSPSMLIEGLRIDRAAYGVYRPAFGDQVYRDVHISNVGSEPFNRGMDDASAQLGSITVDGLLFENAGRDTHHPLIQLSDIALAEGAASHFRRVRTERRHPERALVDRGGSVRADPIVDRGVPAYFHDHYGPGRHAKVVSVKARDILDDGNDYRPEPALTGKEAVAAEVRDVEFPALLDPTDDLPPATVILRVTREGDRLRIRGVSHDDGDIALVRVNDVAAEVLSSAAGIADWEARVAAPADGRITASAVDASGNRELTPHVVEVGHHLAPVIRGPD